MKANDILMSVTISGMYIANISDEVNGLTPICFSSKGINEELDENLISNGFEEWSYISSYNPGSRVVTSERNLIETEKLQLIISMWVAHEGGCYLMAASVPPLFKEENIMNQLKEYESNISRGFLVCGIDRETAILFGRIFEQKSVVFGVVGEDAEVLQCFPESKVFIDPTVDHNSN